MQERDPILHSPAGCADCHEVRDDPVLVSPTDRVVVRLQLHAGRLVDFALVQQRRTGEDAWRDVASADCRHGEVHVHWHNADGTRSGRKVLRPITMQQDVEDGYDEASSIMFEEWDENLRRCMIDGREGG